VVAKACALIFAVSCYM